MNYFKKTVFIILFLMLSILGFAQKNTDNSKLIYIPVYSSINHGDENLKFDLAVTLTIRNLNNGSITVYSVDYYNNSGNLVRNYLNTAITLKSYETVNFLVKESDTMGGSSASFLVKWESGKAANDLFAEAVMIGTQDRRGISFTSRGFSIKKQ